MGNKQTSDYQVISPFDCCRDNYLKLEYSYDILTQYEWNLIISFQGELSYIENIKLLPYNLLHEKIKEQLTHKAWNICKDFRTILVLNMLIDNNVKYFKIFYNETNASIKLKCTQNDNNKIIIWIYPKKLISDNQKALNLMYDLVKDGRAYQKYSIPTKLTASLGVA